MARRHPWPRRKTSTVGLDINTTHGLYTVSGGIGIKLASGESNLKVSNNGLYFDTAKLTALEARIKALEDAA